MKKGRIAATHLGCWRAPAGSAERAASWLSKHFTYWWLEQRGVRTRSLREAEHI